MFADEVLKILNAILDHTQDNDIRFQARKLKQKFARKKYRDLSDRDQRDSFYNVVQEVRLGFDTLKDAKLKATDTIYNIILEKTAG